MRILDTAAPDNPDDWPFDQRYAGRCFCGDNFFGPKRAPSCWKCQKDGGKAWWRSKFNTYSKEGSDDE